MMFYEVLCLKSILGFLLSEHTSGVSGGGSFEKLFDNYVSAFNFCVVRRYRAAIAEKVEWQYVSNRRSLFLGAGSCKQP